jgi:hypothetical protein
MADGDPVAVIDPGWHHDHAAEQIGEHQWLAGDVLGLVGGQLDGPVYADAIVA